MLGGYSSPAKLAAEIGREKFGARTIRSIEEGTRPLEDYEAEWVAEACGIDAAFLTVGLAAPPAPAGLEEDFAADGQLNRIEAGVREILRRLSEGETGAAQKSG